MVKISVEEHTLLTQCLPSDRLSFAEKVYTEYFPVIFFYLFISLYVKKTCYHWESLQRYRLA